MNNTIVIVAGGPSAEILSMDELNKLKDNAFVIAVNGSANITNCNLVLTMDRLYWENNWMDLLAQGKKCAVRHTVYDRWMKESKIHSNQVQRVEMYFNKPGLSKDKNIVYGDNSGICALNYAVNLNPSRIGLVGLDLGGNKPHWYDNYKWSKYRDGNYCHKFIPNAERMAEDIKRETNIEVINFSLKSKLNGFEKRDLKEIIKWLKN